MIEDYTSFKQTQASLQKDMVLLTQYCNQLGMSETGAGISAVREKAASDAFNVAVIGEFKRGKSTLINGLLGRQILPADPLPCSATLNRVTYDAVPHAQIKFKDGKTADIQVDQLEDYVTKLTDESAETAATIEEAVVYYPLSYCKNNVDIIDTPGLNDDETMTAVTMSVIPKVDLSIMAVMALSPFGQYEKDFLENKLMSSSIGKIVFAVTRMDCVNEWDREKVLRHIRKTIETHVKVKAKKVYGEGTPEYEEYLKKLGKVKVIGISPIQAVMGKEKGDESLIRSSNYPEFERELERLLLEERGVIQLSVQASAILSACAEIGKTLALRDQCSQMSLQDFQARYDEAMKKFKAIRADRTRQEEKIDLAAKDVQARITDMVDQYWRQTEEDVFWFIDRAELERDDLSKNNIEATKEGLLNAIQDQMRNSQQVMFEQVGELIQQSIGDEIAQLVTYEQHFFDALSDAFSGIVQTSEGPNVLAAAGSTIASALIAGNVLGAPVVGIYEGYKKGGMKGALVGGAASLGAALAANMAGNALIIATGMTALGWPLLLVVGAAAAFGGHFAIERFVGSAHLIEKFRQGLKDSIADSIHKQKEEGTMVAELHNCAETAFRELKENVHTKSEEILRNTEETLNQLKRQKLENEVQSQQEQKMLKEIDTAVARIAADTKQLYNAVCAQGKEPETC